MSLNEFKELFDAVGSTPSDAKEKSVVKVKSLSESDVAQVFNSLVLGITTQTYSKPHNFSKQRKTGSQPIKVESAHVTYSTNTSNCKFKFTVRAGNGLDSDHYHGFGGGDY